MTSVGAARPRRSALQLLDLALADVGRGVELLARRCTARPTTVGAGGLAEARQLVERFLGVEQGAAAVLHGDQNGPITGLRDVDHSSLTIAEGTPPVKPSVRTRVGDTQSLSLTVAIVMAARDCGVRITRRKLSFPAP